ncbi:MAG: DsbA family protein [Candidatus Longimicrobiales bacterium M2_2A_002]
MQKTRTHSRLAAGAALLLAIVTSPATAQSPVTASALDRALESRAKGGEDATVVIFEIADFQCPYCARFAAEIAPAIDEKYVEPGRVQWVFVNLPLPNHPLAWHAAEAALCAGVAGDQFWPMHDRLFEKQEEWAESDDPDARFAQYAADLGIPDDAFRRCTMEDEVASLILQDFSSAVSAGISGTPTFIIMRDQEVIDRVVGVETVEQWSETLDSALEGGS